jgi:hypothetical protein
MGKSFLVESRFQGFRVSRVQGKTKRRGVDFEILKLCKRTEPVLFSADISGRALTPFPHFPAKVGIKRLSCKIDLLNDLRDSWPPGWGNPLTTRHFPIKGLLFHLAERGYVMEVSGKRA